jgi:hypothetical protein
LTRIEDIVSKTFSTVLSTAIITSLCLPAFAESSPEVKEQVIVGLHNVPIKVRMEGPYTADTTLQVVCYFEYSVAGAKKMTGAPVELDKHLGGVINALRTRGEFRGQPLETILINPKAGAIKAKSLLLVGLGDEDQLSLDLMERVGQTALRQAKELGAKKVAFAPLLRDQGNTALGVGAVETAVVKAVLLAYDTELRLQEDGLSNHYKLEEWCVEAGPAYFDETVAGVREAVSQAAVESAKRPTARLESATK